jgi:uncharacterized protein (AIM24 family)
MLLDSAMVVNNAATQSHGGTSRCKYCGAVIDSSYVYCPGCGATVGRSVKPTNSGWTELPPIKDMARLRVGASTCQIEGIYVPVADFNLAAGDSVYFAHHVLLWKDPQVELKRMVLTNPIIRSLAGMPVVMTEAHGPGHIAFSRDEPGEMIALPLEPGQAIDVREHLMLAATANVHYGWINSPVWYMTDQNQKYHFPTGQFMDRFTAVDQPGLVLLHASGNVMVRRLEAGQTMLIKPGALVYMDRSVRSGLHIQYFYGFGGHRLIWLQVAGPGRVAIQSAYERPEDGGEAITSYSNLLGIHSGNLPKAVDASVQPAGAPTTPAPVHVDPRHVLVVEKVRKVMVGGQVPADAMQPLLDFAAEHGLSAYDVRLIIRHEQSTGR